MEQDVIICKIAVTRHGYSGEADSFALVKKPDGRIVAEYMGNPFKEYHTVAFAIDDFARLISDHFAEPRHLYPLDFEALTKGD